MYLVEHIESTIILPITHNNINYLSCPTQSNWFSIVDLLSYIFLSNVSIYLSHSLASYTQLSALLPSTYRYLFPSWHDKRSLLGNVIMHQSSIFCWLWLWFGCGSGLEEVTADYAFVSRYFYDYICVYWLAIRGGSRLPCAVWITGSSVGPCSLPSPFEIPLDAVGTPFVAGSGWWWASPTSFSFCRFWKISFNTSFTPIPFPCWRIGELNLDRGLSEPEAVEPRCTCDLEGDLKELDRSEGARLVFVDILPSFY